MTLTVTLTAQAGEKMSAADTQIVDAMASLDEFDAAYAESGVSELLRLPANSGLLRYVCSDAFTHVFPGERTSTARDFCERTREALDRASTYHLWTDVPLCRYRCHYCQFPILVVGSHSDSMETVARRWVDAIIAEAKLWLREFPILATKPIGEFCLFGGTPSVLPPAEIVRLVEFYFGAFGFDPSTSLRVEGAPDTLDPSVLSTLRDLGFTSLTYGIQTFDDDLLALANRRHSGAQALAVRESAEAAGFTRVDADLIWGLPGQTVSAFVSDVHTMVEHGFDTVVAVKLHLRSFQDADSAIGHASPAAWENPEVRSRIAERGYAWPSLGTQFQMREQMVGLLRGAGYYEHPTTYFPRVEVGAQPWRALNLDQDQQVPQVGIGLGGYSWCPTAEAHTHATPRAYLTAVERSELPVESVSVVDDVTAETRSVRMALSTCQPLSDDVHRRRFPGASLMGGRWRPVFEDLATRDLATVDEQAGIIALTPHGATLVEAIINTEIV